MKTRSLVWMLFAALCLSTSYGGEVKDVKEQNFEDGLGAWKPRFRDRTEDAGLVPDPDNNANQVCRLFLDPSDPPEPDRKQQTVYVAEGPIALNGATRVILSAKCRIEGDEVYAGFYVFFSDPSTNQSESVPMENEGTLRGDEGKSEQWVSLKKTVVVPSGFPQMYVQLALKGESGTAWFDDVIIQIEYP